MILMDEVNQILLDSMQSRRQTLVFDHAFQFNSRERAVPPNCVAGFDVEVDEEERRDGREVCGREVAR